MINEIFGVKYKIDCPMHIFSSKKGMMIIMNLVINIKQADMKMKSKLREKVQSNLKKSKQIWELKMQRKNKIDSIKFKN